MTASEMKEYGMRRLDALLLLEFVPKKIDGRKTMRTRTLLDRFQHAAYLLEQMRDIDPETDTGRKSIKSLNVQVCLALRHTQ